MKSSNRIVQYTVVTYILLFTGVQAEGRRDSMCKKLSRVPNFNMEQVLGTWRYHYTWMVNMGDNCFNLTFVKATKTIIDRIGLGMIEYMRDEIQWNKATMMTSLVKAADKNDRPRELLLFPKKGYPGGFKGVPNFSDGYDFYLRKYTLPQIEQVYKLFKQGKFLVMADCNLGVAALMARVNQTIYRSEVLATAAEIWPIEGYLSCTLEKNENEIEGTLTDSKEIPNSKMY